MSHPEISHLFNSDLTHKRKQRTADGQGGYTYSWETQSTIAGRVNPASARDLEVAAKQRAEVTHAVYLDPSEDVKIGDRLVYGNRDLEVKVPDQTPSVPIYKKVLCLEIQEA